MCPATGKHSARTHKACPALRQRALAFAETQPEQGGAREANNDDGDVERTQAHGGVTENADLECSVLEARACATN